MKTVDWVLLLLSCASMYVACFSFWLSLKLTAKVDEVTAPEFGTLAELEARIAGMEAWRVTALDAQFARDLAHPIRKRTGV